MVLRWKLDASDASVSLAFMSLSHISQGRRIRRKHPEDPDQLPFYLSHCLNFDSIFVLSVDSPRGLQDELGGLVISLVRSSEGGRLFIDDDEDAGSSPSLLDDHAARQVLGVVLKELGRGAGAVGQFQFLQILQLDQA